MKEKRFSDEQIIGILKEAEASAPVTELHRKHRMSRDLLCWRAKFRGLEVSDMKRLRSLKEEDARLKQLLADTMLDNAGLKDLLSKDGRAQAVAHNRRSGLHDYAVSLEPGR